jgi:hypothetical protein
MKFFIFLGKLVHCDGRTFGHTLSMQYGHSPQVHTLPLSSDYGQPQYDGQMPQYGQSLQARTLLPSRTGLSLQLTGAAQPHRRSLPTEARCLLSSSRSGGYRPLPGPAMKVCSRLAITLDLVPADRLARFNGLDPRAQQAAMCSGSHDTPEGLLDQATLTRVLDRVLASPQMALMPENIAREWDAQEW